tara:strand:+ start:99 stop:281 length:183 start_codon:yes stop_codon:yes gene_type:complete
MAKKQTFGDKTGKSSAKSKSMIKLVKAGKSNTGFLRFKEEIVAVPEDKNADTVVKELLSK